MRLILDVRPIEADDVDNFVVRTDLVVPIIFYVHSINEFFTVLGHLIVILFGNVLVIHSVRTPSIPVTDRMLKVHINLGEARSWRW